MLVHSVYFWLKRDLTPEQRQSFRHGLESLGEIRSVESIYIGQPASTDRPVIDRSYDFGLTVIFKDIAGHDAYQVDPVHKQFVDTYGKYWERVTIYDAE